MAHPESSATPSRPAEPHQAREVTLTWAVTETYTHPLDLAAVATAAGRSVEELRADPASVLSGAVPQHLADLLAGHQDEAVNVDEPEVEITDAYLTDQPTLGDLIRAGWRHVHAEAVQRTGAGRALAALLVGLRREGITHR
ncbi:hypothetical protein WEI85_00670 [Actinomycetes bacterium KLBMP 9797]